jgi:hypothetical protein
MMSAGHNARTTTLVERQNPPGKGACPAAHTITNSLASASSHQRSGLPPWCATGASSSDHPSDAPRRSSVVCRRSRFLGGKPACGMAVAKRASGPHPADARPTPIICFPWPGCGRHPAWLRYSVSPVKRRARAAPLAVGRGAYLSLGKSAVGLRDHAKPAASLQ